VAFHSAHRLGVLLLHSGVRNQEEIGSSSLDIYTGTWPGHWYDFAKDLYLLGHDQARIYARGPGPGRKIFRGGILKKSRLKYGMRKKRLSTREKFKGDLY